MIQIYNKRVFVAPFQAKSRGLIPTGVKHNNAIVCGERVHWQSRDFLLFTYNMPLCLAFYTIIYSKSHKVRQTNMIQTRLMLKLRHT